MKLERFIAGVFALVLAVAIAGLAAPLTSSFVYQGFLRDGNGPASGVYEIHFRLYDAGTNGTLLASEIVEPSVAVTNGVFAASLEFGPGVFTGDARWLELAVGRAGDTNGSTVLQPRQRITATPYASYALAAPVATGSVGAAQLAPGAVQTVNLGDAAVTGDKIANQQVVRSLNGLADQVTLEVGAGLALYAVGGNTLRITSNIPDNPLDYATNNVTMVAGSSSVDHAGKWRYPDTDTIAIAGWGSALGTIPRIDSLAFWIKPFSNCVVSLVDAQLRFDSAQGPVVAHSQLPVAATYATPAYVNWAVPASLVNTNSRVVFFQYLANDRVNVMDPNTPTYPYPSNQTPGVYLHSAVTNLLPALAFDPDKATNYQGWWNGTPTNNGCIFATWSTNTGEVTVSHSAAWTNFMMGVISNVIQPTAQAVSNGFAGTLSQSVLSLSNSLVSLANQNAGQSAAQVKLLLPTTLFATAGREFDLYNAGFLWADDYSRIYIRWSAPLGTNLSECWRAFPTDSQAGTNYLTLFVSSDDTDLLTVPISLVISSNAAAAGVSRKVLIIGDSTTANGIPTGDLLNLFSTNSMAITLLGTVDSGGGTNRHEGRSGWAYSTFAQSINSPFLFSGHFDFGQYLGANGWSMTNADWVIFNLGINDIFGATSDSDAISDALAAWQSAAIMVTNIMAVVPGIRVGLCLTIPPAPTQDAFGNNYGSSVNGERDRYLRNRAIFNSQVLASYSTLGTNVFVVPLSAAVNPVYGFDSTMQPESLRVTNLVARYSNAVHPNTVGDQQVADMYFHFIKGNEK